MSQTEWEPLGFFSEALCNATSFDIKLGFFSSSAINVLADGFAAFLYNGGRMRMIINDVLSEEDRNAMVVAESDINTPYFDLTAIDRISYTLSKRDEHFFECLSWLIRHERIEIKIITPKVGNGIAHSKCGVFSDGINKVAFDGSCNFSRMALIENIESINAFCDCESGKTKCARFEKRNVQKSGKTKRAKKIAHTTLQRNKKAVQNGLLLWFLNDEQTVFKRGSNYAALDFTSIISL